MTYYEILNRPSRQSGSAAMVLIVGVVVVIALTVGAGAFYVVSQGKKPITATAVGEPTSPYDSLVDGDSNNDLKSNVLNIKSGLSQEELHLKGVDTAVSDQQGVITNQ